MKIYAVLLLSLLLLGCVSQPMSQASGAQQTTDAGDAAPELETSDVENVGEDVLNISSELGELDISDEELEQLE